MAVARERRRGNIPQKLTVRGKPGSKLRPGSPAGVDGYIGGAGFPRNGGMTLFQGIRPFYDPSR